jgi:hypothetical protein
MIDHRDRSFEQLEAVVRRSVMVRAWQRAVTVIRPAAVGSAVLRSADQQWRRYLDRPSADRVRLLGVGLLSFAAADLALTTLAPAAAAPAFPAVVWGTTAAAGLFCIVSAGPLGTAWNARGRQRVSSPGGFERR